MQVLRRAPTLGEQFPPPISSLHTTFLWTEKGVINTATHMLFSYTTTATPDTFGVSIRPFKGSVSKVYHSEPATVTWYTNEMWREETPDSDFVFTVKRS
jgi:hypothetical protein